LTDPAVHGGLDPGRQCEKGRYMRRGVWVAVAGMAAVAVMTATTAVLTWAGARSRASHRSGKTSLGPSGPRLPDHLLTGYWQNFHHPSAMIRLRDVPKTYDVVVVAFAAPDPGVPGKVTFGVDPQLSAALGGYTDGEVKRDVAALHARGAKVLISVGGERGTVAVRDATAARNFASSVYDLIRDYGFDGVDIDFEEGFDPEATSDALWSLYDKVGERLIITVAPETVYMRSESDPYLALVLKIQKILTVVHTQYYNSGSMRGCDGRVYQQGTVDFVTSQVCTIIVAGLRPDQVAIGVPAAAAAAGGGYLPPGVVNTALDCLTRKLGCGVFTPSQPWPTLRGVMTWSVNWDLTAGTGFSATVASHLDTLP
jgi:chitinase